MMGTDLSDECIMVEISTHVDITQNDEVCELMILGYDILITLKLKTV
jgi:hypothetical protein